MPPLVDSPAWLGAHAHVMVGDLVTLTLTEADRHHLARVLRIRPGTVVTATDGRGSWRTCRAPSGWPSAGDELVADGSIVVAAQPTPTITLALALTKGDKPEWAVQKLTELGVDRIVLVSAERSVVRWDPTKVDRNLTRLRSVAREALMQSRGVWMPTIEGVRTVAEVVALNPDVAMAEFGGAEVSLGHPAVLIGPEGGWTEDELALVKHRVSLSAQVLRAETAAVACVTVLATQRMVFLGKSLPPYLNQSISQIVK